MHARDDTPVCTAPRHRRNRRNVARDRTRRDNRRGPPKLEQLSRATCLVYHCAAPLTYEFLIPCAQFLCMNKKVAKKSSDNIFGEATIRRLRNESPSSRKAFCGPRRPSQQKARQATGSQARHMAPFLQLGRQCRGHAVEYATAVATSAGPATTAMGLRMRRRSIVCFTGREGKRNCLRCGHRLSA